MKSASLWACCWAILLLPGMSYAPATKSMIFNTKNREVMMSTTQQNKEVIRKLYEEGMNQRNWKLLEDLISEDYVGLSEEKGVAAFKAPITGLLEAFPDAQWHIVDLIAEGEKVMVKQQLQGTHRGPLALLPQVPATDRAITNDGIAIYELVDGKIISAQVQTDRLSFLQQLEGIPSDIAQLTSKKALPTYLRFIDKFYVPAEARQEFMKRVVINRSFIRNLPGFVEDAAYERTDEHGNLVFLTIAVWENEEVLKKAKEAVQAEYRAQGFDMAEMFERLNITMERGIYRALATNP